MRPSNLQSRLIDTYGTLCDKTGLNRLPFAEARQLSIETLRHLIKWQQHVAKHRGNECPPPFIETPPGGWDAFEKRGVAKKGAAAVAESEATRRQRIVASRSGLTERQRVAAKRVAVEAIEEDYVNQ